MSFASKGSRHLRTLWQSKERCWEWWGLFYGHAQRSPTLGWSYRRDAWLWQFHVTPIHVSRDPHWHFGLCIGRRTVYVMRHR